MVLNNTHGIQISEETRQRVLQAAHDLGYVPDAAAQALASRRAQIIGLLLTRSPHHVASDAYLTLILDGLLQIVRRQGLRLMVDIVETQHQKEAYLQLVRAKRIDGLLLSGPQFDDEALRLLGETGFPTVLLGQVPSPDFCSVDIDNRQAARGAVGHLIKLGHTRIACITNAAAIYTAATERLNGYRQALEEAGLPFEPGLVRFGDFDPQSGYNGMHSLLASGQRFSAVFVASDTVALGAKAALRERGLNVPGDVAMVGFDDVPVSRYMDPPLTTVHLPAEEQVEKSTQMLFQLIRREEPAERHIMLSTQLVVRQSCGADQRQSILPRGNHGS